MNIHSECDNSLHHVQVSRNTQCDPLLPRCYSSLIHYTAHHAMIQIIKSFCDRLAAIAKQYSNLFTQLILPWFIKFLRDCLTAIAKTTFTQLILPWFIKFFHDCLTAIAKITWSMLNAYTDLPSTVQTRIDSTIIATWIDSSVITELIWQW